MTGVQTCALPIYLFLHPCSSTCSSTHVPPPMFLHLLLNLFLHLCSCTSAPPPVPPPLSVSELRPATPPLTAGASVGTPTQPRQTKTEVGQMAERLGNWAFKSESCWFDSPTVPNYVVSLGKALHPTCLWENVPVLTVSRSG